MPEIRHKSWHQCIIPGMENGVEAKLEGSKLKKYLGYSRVSLIMVRPILKEMLNIIELNGS